MEIQEIIAKLTASRKLLQAKLVDEPMYIALADVQVIYERYANLREVLQSDYPSLFADLLERPIPPQDGINGSQPLTYAYHVVNLVEDMSYCLDLFSSIATPTAPPATVTREGMFFSGQVFDALLKITDLINQAQKSISIIDAYINEDVLKLLTGKVSQVTADVLTKKVEPNVIVAATKFNKQYGGLSIRTSQAFHDRFVIIDGRDFYHFGASLKDLGNRGFMFSRIEETIVMNALQAEFSKEWAASTMVV